MCGSQRRRAKAWRRWRGCLPGLGAALWQALTTTPKPSSMCIYGASTGMVASQSWTHRSDTSSY
ncbi:hypothetical protein DPMN_004770 [Dreissena polymorpha]|uniref:Secreted protein n=1 Tax=Dreissena polymorpha TaxID=45954 RepID=A0A9D4MP34_DREPO|nr:hypothetical protein DPMN_004770 [Dreissena polymorpha]